MSSGCATPPGRIEQRLRRAPADLAAAARSGLLDAVPLADLPLPAAARAALAAAGIADAGALRTAPIEALRALPGIGRAQGGALLALRGTLAILAARAGTAPR